MATGKKNVTKATHIIIGAIIRAKLDGRDYVACADFGQEPDFPGCCASCHEDEETGYDTLFQGPDEFYGGMDAHLCCAVSLYLREKDKHEYNDTGTASIDRTSAPHPPPGCGVE